MHFLFRKGFFSALGSLISFGMKNDNPTLIICFQIGLNITTLRTYLPGSCPLRFSAKDLLARFSLQQRRPIERKKHIPTQDSVSKSIPRLWRATSVPLHVTFLFKVKDILPTVSFFGCVLWLAGV